MAVKQWILAARPKTLPAAFVPVVTGTVLAWKSQEFKWVPALVCLLFALLVQIGTNYANDYFDYIKGTDREDRLGPKRAVASGWVSARSMFYATVIVLFLAFLIGSVLIIYGGWLVLAIGIASIFFSYGYTGGPFPLAYRGLGDAFVFVFFGIIAVSFTFYVQAKAFFPEVFLAGGIIGFLAVNILVVNNYRDRDTDSLSGKKTTVVLFGEKFGQYFYLFNGNMAAILCLFFLWKGWIYAALLPQVTWITHIYLWRRICVIHSGSALNPILGKTALQLIFFAVLLNIGILLS